MEQSRPADDDREFTVDDLFFSTTDRKGVVTSCNRVFERVSGYDETELLGKAHNLVRHPDMPRAVFQTFWDALTANEPVAAFVKNRRKDGGHYWVMAVALPIEGGYLSVRMKPTSELCAVAEGMYKELRVLELGIESGDGKARKRAIEAGQERLAELLARAGFESYDAFMRHALPVELGAREAARSRAADRTFDHGDPGLQSILACTRRSGRWLDRVFANLGAYQTLNAELAERSTFVSELAESIRLFSMNALVKATRLGSRAVALGAVADLMGQRSHRIGSLLGSLMREIDAAVALLSRISFESSLAKLQTEMATAFAEELLDHDEPDPARELRLRRDIAMLAGTVAGEVESLVESLARVDGHLERVRLGAAALARELSTLHALQMNGVIESAHLDDAGDVEALFVQIREQLDDAAGKAEAFVALTEGSSKTRVRVPHTLSADLAELRGTRAELAVA